MLTYRLALALTLAASTASAGGFGIPEIGVRRTAMGSIIGRPDDPSAIYHNPAGLALSEGWQIYLSAGVSFLGTEFQLRPWQDTLTNGETRSSDDFVDATAGADGYYAPVKPTRAFGVIPMIAATYEHIPHRLWFGAGVYVGNATGAAFDDRAVTRYHLVDGYVVAPQAVGSVAYKLLPSLVVGATAGVMNLRIHGTRYFYPILNHQDFTQFVGREPKLTLDGSTWAPTYVIGAFGQPHERVTWGATITKRTDATVEGPVRLDYEHDGVADSQTGTQQTNVLLPWAFMAGANVDVTPNVEIGGEYRYWLYRQYEKQTIKVTGILFVSEPIVSQKNYNDSWEASGGVRVHDLPAVPGLDVMAGLQYDKSPAPPEAVTLDQPSFSHWGLHSGLRYSVGRYRIGASYIHYWYRIPTIESSITLPPSNIRGTGANNIFTASLEVKL